jgi:acyl transferase domain-containing protein/acyl carrier protein
MKDIKLSSDNIKIIKQAYDKLKSIQAQKIEPIAIVGMGCRLPKAPSIDAYWNLLSENIDAISTTPSDRYDIYSYYNAQLASSPINNPYGGYIDHVYDFDARFFDLSPKEALMLDPQQRLLLEITVEALENANLPTHKLSKVNTSVYIGISSFDYGARLQSNEEEIDSYLGTGTLLSPAAGRISYFLNLNGPSMVIDTACSSSLVAIHQAITSLRSGESDVSIVGGVGLLLEPSLNICFSKANMLSPDGRCKTFDDAANGYVRGEGCAVIILKKLNDAIRDKDNIQALILGSAVNQDGASGGLTIPSGPSQEKVIQRALVNANITAKDVNYVEAHGTGTSLGDPIEINALGEVFNHGQTNKLKVGSVKTNIGYLEACSGLASIIKVVLAMQNNMIPASLHFNHPNSKIAWDQLPIEIVDQNIAWSHDNTRKVAGISSFGFSGTNSHVIVAESPLLKEESKEAYTKVNEGVLTISGKDKNSLLNNVKKLHTFLQNTNNSIDNVCFTSNVGRNHYKDRIAFVASSTSDALHKITQSINYLNGKKVDAPSFYVTGTQNSNINIEFIFSGMQGMDNHCYIDIYKNYKHHPYFQNILTKCKDTIISNNWSTIEEWNDLLEQNNSTTLLLNLVTLSIHYALAKLMIYIGIKPKIVMGQGLGEYVAAGVSGIFSLEDMLYMIYHNIVQHSANSTDLFSTVTIKKPLSIQFQGSSDNQYKVDSTNYWNFYRRPLNQSVMLTEKFDCSVIIGVLPSAKKSQTTFTVINNNKHDNSINNSLPGVISYLYAQGMEIMWDYYHQGIKNHKVNLPTYAWNKNKYMIENKNKKNTGYSIVKHSQKSSPEGIITFDCQISLDKLDFIKDHKVFGKIVFPESTYLEMLIEASDLLSDSDNKFALQHIFLVHPYVFTDNQSVHMQLVCTPKDHMLYDIELISNDDSNHSTTHIKGQIIAGNHAVAIQDNQDLAKLQSAFSSQVEIDIPSYYQEFANTGVTYGSSFKSISKAFLSSDKNSILGLIESKINIGESYYNPVILDGCLQLIAACLAKHNDQSTYFIMSIGSVESYKKAQDKVWCHIIKQSHSQFPIFDLVLLNDQGDLIAKISSLQINYGNESALILNKTKNWFYSVALNEVSNNSVNILDKLKHNWLVFSDSNDSLTQDIQNLLKSYNINVIGINSDNYKTVIKEHNVPIQGVIFAVGSNIELYDKINHQSLEMCLQLLDLVKSLETTSTRLCVITKNVHSDSNIRPQQSSLWGMGRVLLLERPKLNPIFIDYDDIVDGLDKNIVSDIINEDKENQIVYKNGIRHILRLQYEHVVQTNTFYHVDPNAMYLITGAFGALGLRISQLLVERGAKNLILISRSGATTDYAKSIVKDFKEKGIRLQELQLDLSKDNQEINLQLGMPLKGVIHTAGVLDDHLLSNHTGTTFEKVMSPKIQGTWNLHQWTKNEKLDFFVCFSSMTSVIGAMGQANYAAANYFMDVFCRYRRSQNLPAISISWGPWSGSGMGAKQDLLDHWSKMGMGTIDLDEGALIFEKLLDSHYAHIGVMPTDWSKYPDQNSFFSVLKELKNIEKTSSTILLELQDANKTQRRKMLVKLVEGEVCRILGYEVGKQSFEEDQGFFELGMNSLTAIEFKNNLEDMLDCQLSSTLTFDYPTIAKLVNYLDLDIISRNNEQESMAVDVETVEESDDDIVMKLSQQLGL